MNDIVLETTKSLDIKIGSENPARDVLSMFAAYTPQFYKYSSNQQKEKEIYKIQCAITGIELQVLQKMCELCLINYKFAISRDRSIRINLDYFLSFYIESYNFIFVRKPEKPYKLISSELNNGIIRTEYKLLDADGNERETLISCRIPEAKELERLLHKNFDNERAYTREYLDSMYDDISELN